MATLSEVLKAVTNQIAGATTGLSTGQGPLVVAVNRYWPPTKVLQAAAKDGRCIIGVIDRGHVSSSQNAAC